MTQDCATSEGRRTDEQLGFSEAAGAIERVEHGGRMEQVFTAPTVEGANHKADQWLAQQKGIWLLSRSQTSARLSSTTSVQGAEWTVTIRYERLH
jgi:hypothetical protein